MNVIARRSLSGILAFLWLVLVVVFYYAGHKPFTPDLAFNLLSAFIQFLVALVLVSLAGGLGARLLPGIDLPPLARAALQAACGLGLFGLGVLALGATLGLKPLLAWIAVLLLGLFLWRDGVGWVGSARERGGFGGGGNPRPGFGPASACSMTGSCQIQSSRRRGSTA